MLLPRGLARFNKVFTNRLFGPVAGRVPPWVLVEHRGRRSGRLYRTVVMAFPRGDTFVFALTYGPSTDWVRNTVDGQWCRVKWAGRWREFNRADLIDGQPAQALLPPILGSLLHAVGVSWILYVEAR